MLLVDKGRVWISLLNSLTVASYLLGRYFVRLYWSSLPNPVREGKRVFPRKLNYSSHSRVTFEGAAPAGLWYFTVDTDWNKHTNQQLHQSYWHHAVNHPTLDHFYMCIMMRSHSFQPATREGSPTRLEQGHVSQLRRGSIPSTSLWNPPSDDGSLPPDGAGNGDSGGWRLRLVKYGPVRGETGWGGGHHSPGLTSSLTLPAETVEGQVVEQGTLPIKAVSLNLPSPRSPPISWNFPHEHPNFSCSLSRKESLN